MDEWQYILEFGKLSSFVFLAAFIGGFFSSTPLGPINLWIVDSALTPETQRTIKPFVVGVVLADACFATIAILGYHTLFKEVLSSELLIFTGSAFLFFFWTLFTISGLSKK